MPNRDLPEDKASPILHRLRQDYRREELLEATSPLTPEPLFRRWLDEALGANLYEPNAMALATVGADGLPSVRIVLLKGVDERGWIFYTNYKSRKGHALAAHPVAAATMWWGPLERQVRVEGPVSRLPADESDAYFASRPRGSQFGALVSAQSAVIPNKQALWDRLAELERQFADTPPTRPEHWGGYILSPERYEFWQGGPQRLHDRLSYQRIDGGWRRERLSP